MSLYLSSFSNLLRCFVYFISCFPPSTRAEFCWEVSWFNSLINRPVFLSWRALLVNKNRNRRTPRVVTVDYLCLIMESNPGSQGDPLVEASNALTPTVRTVVCPYDKLHVVRRSRIRAHMRKCRKDHPEYKYIFCSFNDNHFVPIESLPAHAMHCPDNPKNKERELLEYIASTGGFVDVISPVDEAANVSSASSSVYSTASSNTFGLWCVCPDTVRFNKVLSVTQDLLPFLLPSRLYY